ncbi:hypothetical protein LPJ81_005810 [Coemansia sp. IMI 209127]|nr:hypothetical protein LPJ81_005810 [Coemansia sp. IMI 209127]
MLLYMEAASDHGFVSNSNIGLFKPFQFRDVVGVDLESIADIADVEIRLQGHTSLSGRHTQPVGAQSWIYRDVHNRIVKFHWCLPQNSEIAIHRRVMEMGIPYVPRLLNSVVVKHPLDEMQGELLQIDDAGTSISDAILRLRIASHTVIDLFAGYSHAILAASSGRGGGVTVLHRDISIGNLLVRESQPFVIDWGLGLCTHESNRVASTTPRVGTAPFMGVRVLNSQPKRSCVDDLESLFLAISQCMWRKHGTAGKSYSSLWENCYLADVLSERKAWLFYEQAYLEYMGLDNAPQELVTLLKGMYGLLFSTPGENIYSIDSKPEDPRLQRFKAADWVAVFDGAKGMVVTDDNYPCLDRLRAFVEGGECFDNARSSSGKRPLDATKTSPQQLKAVASEKPSKIPRLTAASSSKVGKKENKGRYNFRARGGKENLG